MENTKNQAYGALTAGRSRRIRVREDLSVYDIDRDITMSRNPELQTQRKGLTQG